MTLQATSRKPARAMETPLKLVKTQGKSVEDTIKKQTRTKHDEAVQNLAGPSKYPQLGVYGPKLRVVRVESNRGYMEGLGTEPCDSVCTTPRPSSSCTGFALPLPLEPATPKHGKTIRHDSERLQEPSAPLNPKPQTFQNREILHSAPKPTS